MAVRPWCVLLLAAALSATPAPVRAQPAALDLPGAVRFALDHSPSILARRASVESDEATFARLHAAEFPPLTGLLQNQLSKSSNQVGAFAQYGVTPAQSYSQNNAQIGTAWNLYTGSNAQISAQQAKRQAESARGDLRRAEQQLAQDVTNGYFTVVARHETVRLDAADRDFQQALLDVARANERVGRVAGVDVLRARVSELRARSTLLSAQADEANAREALAQTIGAPPDQSFSFAGDVPEPALPTTPLESLVARAQAQRGDVAGARASLAAARLADGLIDTDRLPQLALSAAFGNQFSPTSYGASLQALQGAGIGGPGAPRLARGNPGFWQIGATETLQLGLIDYGARHAQHRAAHAGIESAQATLGSTEHAVETDVRQAVRGLTTAYANLATAKEASSYGAESARISQLQYRNGLISLTDATQAERDNLQTQVDLVNARVAYVEAFVHVRVAVGTADPVAIVDVRSP